MNRREFVIGSTAALLMAVAGGSYALSTCPLDTEGTGICTGPCSAFIDFDGDGFCDRVPPPPQVAQAIKPDTAGGSVTVIRRACPFGLLNDPYPGECNLYVDADNDGICDLSQSGTTTADGGETVTSDPDGAGELVQEVDQASSSASVIQTACPLGLVNDPYPGECRRYVDDNQNGICDLSEPALIASGEIAPLPTPTQAPEQAAGLAPIPRPQTACPYGLVNDPYPGECRKYVDNNNNGICDLSEPELVASGAVLPPSTDTTEHSADGQGGGQQRQRGKNN